MKAHHLVKGLFLLITVIFSFKMYQTYFPNRGIITSAKPPQIKQDESMSFAPTGHEFGPGQQEVLVKNIQENNLKNIDINIVYKDMMTPFLHMVGQERIDLVKKYIDKVEDINHQSLNGNTALVMSAGAGNIEITKLLLKHGANPNIIFNRRNFTLLMDASMEGNIELINLLLDNNAKINSQDKEGMTALMYAAKQGNISAVNKLLHNSANKLLKNSDGLSALDLAIRNDHKEVTRLLSN